MVFLRCGREDLNLHGSFTRWSLNLVKAYHELQKLLFKASVYFIYIYFHHFS
ncbi:hypothetical protein EFW58_03724 [Bacillus velezensis]|nr:hypothetical protein EFW58_03724 [Bacillus velezensis]